MIKLSRVFRDYRDSGAVNALVNVHAAIDDHTFLTKGGDLLVVLKVAGVDYDCREAADIDQFARRFESTIRIFDEQFRIYQYQLKRSCPAIPHSTYDDPVVDEAISARVDYLQKKTNTLYGLDTYFVIVLESGRASKNWIARLGAFFVNPWHALRETLSYNQKIASLDEDLDRGRELLNTKVNSLVVQLRDSVKAEVLDKHEAFRFLHRLLNFTAHKTDSAKLRGDSFVDFQLCDSTLECHRDRLCLDDQNVQVLTLKEPPSKTVAHLIKGLQEMPCQFVLTTEWKRISNLKARRMIQSKRRHFHNSKTSFVNYLGASDSAPKDVLVDDAASAFVGNLGSCLEELEVKGNTFGEFSLTIVLFDEDPARLKRSVAECFKVFATLDAPLTEERYNLLNSFLAVLPGNHAFNHRKMCLLSTNYADLSLLFTLHSGETTNRHLGAEYLAVLETTHNTPYFFNLHFRDVAHTLILGSTGSGKSFVINFLLTHAQKYRPLIYIFDLGGSYQSLTQLSGGTYVPVGVQKRSFTINPFRLPPTPENLRFLASFVRVLAESGGSALTASDERDVFEQIGNLYAVEPPQRRLMTLSNILGRNVRQALQKWVQGGEYGDLFDNVEDNLTMARFQTFDFEGMDRVPQVLEPLLFYVLHRANSAIEDGELATTFKLFVIDEAWRFLRHPTIRLYVQSALKTWRKKNAAMLMATQSADDLLHSEMLPVIAENCPTRLFLANPGMDRATYQEAFHLNDTEADLIAQLIPKRQILIKQPDIAKVVNLNVDPKGYWLYTNSPYDNQKKREAFEKHGFHEGLEILARSHPNESH